ncbi:MAG: NAD(P)-binding protein [Myxococcales bacterium]|nr:NAD(P)-binding protein [Myxococcales bacterium]
MRSGQTKVLILGGGMGGLAAAFELTRPERQGQYEVTVYTPGWRLGGKGASARNPAHHQRIEEHGLHLWMGCYENAFRVMRDCYETLARPPGTPLATWEDAFQPKDTVVLQERMADGWTPWPQRFPVLDSRPGESDGVAGPVELLTGLVRWAVSTLTDPLGDTRWTPGRAAVRRADPAPSAGHVLSADVLLGTTGARWISWLSERIEGALDRLWYAREPALLGPALAAMARLAKVARWGIRRIIGRRLEHPDLRRTFLTADYLFTTVVGVLADGLVLDPAGRWASYGEWLLNLERIDHEDYRAWLLRHGAHPATTESCMVRGLQDAVFNSAYPGSAGVALNGLVRLNMTYRGSVFYKMMAGMGETVFTPLYEVLRARGVRFEFFHRVDALHLDPTRQRVASVEVTRQARLRDGEYRPLVDVELPNGNLACWPSEPDWAQLEGGEALRAAGVDLEGPGTIPGEERYTVEGFDAVVLAVSLAGLPPITRELASARQEWRDMLERIVTTRTISAQLWFDRSAADMGWQRGAAVSTAYADPLDTWADMTHLIPMERFDGAASQCSYLVGSLDDEDDGVAPALRARRIVEDWLPQHLGHILPRAVEGGAVRWERLVGDAPGAARLDQQYIRANVRPSDRYVLSLPGTTRYRLRPHRSGFENLMVAGDWTKTGLNVGSVEAATMSGLRAAKGLTRDDVLIVGDYDD